MIRPVVKMERGRAGKSGPDATATVRVVVRDTNAADLRAIIHISEGNDGITRISVTPGDACEVRVNEDDIDRTAEVTA